MKYFSRKKNIYIAFVMLSFIAILFVIFSSKNELSPMIFEREVDINNRKIVSLLASLDSDGDGLLDWEESLWKTDPNNPDSDNDGTTDGEETRIGRDPAKPAPKDEMEKTERDLVNKNGPLYIPATTTTGVFVEDFFKQYLVLKQTGDGKVTEKSKSIFIDSIMENVSFKDSLKSVTHGIDELKILYGIDSGDDALREYGNSLAQVFIDSVNDAGEHEVIIINELFTNDKEPEDAKKIAERLRPVIVEYKNIISEFILMEVPEDTANLHLEMINEYENIASALGGILVFFTDTIRGIAGISLYRESTRQITSIGDNLTDMFSSKGVIFEKDEVGALFFNIKQN